MRQLCLLSLAIGFATVLVGCSIRVADMTLMSTRIVALDRVDIDKLPVTRRVVGEDSRWNILGIPLGVPHLKDAVDDALNKGNGDLMTDAVIYQTGWTAIIVGQNSLRVEGDVVKTRK
jgi:hypothetical protein